MKSTNRSINPRRLAHASVLIAMLAMLLVAVGCNTVKGFGRDVESVAQGGQDMIDGKH